MSVLITPPDKLIRTHALAQSLHIDHDGQSRDPFVAAAITRAFTALHQAQVNAWNLHLPDGAPTRAAVSELDLDQRWPEEDQYFRFGDNRMLLHSFISELGWAIYNADGLLPTRNELDLYLHCDRPALLVLAGVLRL
ncbi:hypothetical protein ACFXPX_38555 [Kitasatospora sp. NPDC059146]|uniref:hypothetical protein n=1 Tax=unclassified Kitasatospora TaxID=2633591 RepID=UPI0036BDC8DE